MERLKGDDPSTSALATRCSTNVSYSRKTSSLTTILSSTAGARGQAHRVLWQRGQRPGGIAAALPSWTSPPRGTMRLDPMVEMVELRGVEPLTS